MAVMLLSTMVFELPNTTTGWGFIETLICFIAMRKSVEVFVKLEHYLQIYKKKGKNGFIFVVWNICDDVLFCALLNEMW